MGFLTSAFQQIFGTKDFQQPARFRDKVTLSKPLAYDLPPLPARGTAMSTLVMLDEDVRLTTWDLDSGSATSFTDAWLRSAISDRVPVGVKALYLHVIVRLNGDGILDQGLFDLRKNGSAVPAGINSRAGAIFREDMTANITIGTESDIPVQLCDEQGIVEYVASDAAVDVWLAIRGYWL